MTEEQIKQNAEYFASHINGNKAPFSSREYEAFIAGAHSRDEEIQKLKNELWKLKLEKGNLIADNTLLQQKLHKHFKELKKGE